MLDGGDEMFGMLLGLLRRRCHRADHTTSAPLPPPPQFEVYARQTAHPSGYVMAFTNGEKDVDVSSHLHSSRLFEPVYTWAWHLILKDGCRGTAGEQRLVADIGANVS